jgi:hypothetical protein
MAPDGTLRLRQLRLGHNVGDRIEILSGVEPGERIVADPTAALAWLADARMADARK